MTAAQWVAAILLLFGPSVLVILWFTLGVRHIVCRLRGHAYTWPGYSYDARFCWREARELRPHEYDR